MTEYAPSAIQNMFNRIKAGIPDAIMAGIIGDAAHTYGYHRGRNYCGSGDYSCQQPPDLKGDGEAASAIDISWGKASSQYTVSQRLMNAANDSRMNPIRSFFGSTDGYTVCGWDYYGNYPVASDDSHLWHIHISVLREHANNTSALAAVADVITGGGSAGVQPPATGDWFDMATQKDLEASLRKVLNEGTGTGQASWASTNKSILSGVQQLYNMVNGLKTQSTSEFSALESGDGRDVPVGKDTHPWNLKVVRQLCLDILEAIQHEGEAIK